MTTRVRLFEASLGYHDGMQIYTAVSGPVRGLDEIYLLIERDDQTLALGELRLNMAFLTGIEPAAMRAEVRSIVESIDWRLPPDRLLAQMPARSGSWSTPARALVDMTLHDARARVQGVPLAVSLGGRYRTTVPTNQCIFWCDDDTLISRVQGYLARGFTDLKLRIGISTFDHDRRRLEMIRERLPDQGTLSADVNGSWTLEEASERLPILAQLGLSYLEQPIAPGNRVALERLLAQTPLTIMLDEQLTSLREIEQLAELEGPLAAHLKLPKLGGIGPVMEAARHLDDCAIPYMMGQMNEGGCATAAIIHCAMATRPTYLELYGADGIAHDPAAGVRYADGAVSTPPGAGLALTLDTSRAQLLTELEL